MSSEKELAARVTELERELENAKKAALAGGLRHNLYERVTISPRTLDMTIIVCALLIVVLMIIGAVH